MKRGGRNGRQREAAAVGGALQGRGHRRSIRLKGHDYAGGGTYFVTMCAHRDAGNIFEDASVKEMVGRVWEDLPNVVGAGLVPALSSQESPHGGWAKGGAHKESPYVVMPDHFHGIVRISGGGCGLGDVVGAFKSLVVHEYIAGVKADRFAPFPGKVWHRNYYERVIRDAEEMENVRNYIRMNPWSLITEGTHEGRPYRAIGNPNLLNLPKIGMLCSRNCPAEILEAEIREARGRRGHPQGAPVLSGFHSLPEKAILAALLQSKVKLICCPAWGIDTMKIPAVWLPALEQNRMLILEMNNGSADLAASRERNTFVMQAADELWIPHVSPNGMLARLMKDLNVQGKITRNQ